MIHQSPAHIYTAKQRGHIETDRHRLIATLNFGAYADATRKPFGALTVVNDETLAPLMPITRRLDDTTAMLVIPLVGALHYSLGAKEQELVPGEAVVLLPYSKGTTVTFSNPYEADLINFLYINLKSNGSKGFGVSHINLDIRNTLHPFTQLGICGYMGIFDGRNEVLYPVNNTANGLFAFVVNGAFEVNGRLLEERDALALWETDAADIEALSDNAIILLLEVPLNTFTA